MRLFYWFRRKANPELEWNAWPLLPQYGDTEKMNKVFRAIYGKEGYMIQVSSE